MNVSTGDSRVSGAVIVGAYQSKYSKTPDTTALHLLINSVAESIEGIGVEPQSVDGLAVSSFQLPPDNVVTVAEQLGLELSWAYQAVQGGAGPLIGVISAAEAITQGRVSIAVCAAADAFHVESHMGLFEQFNSGMRDYLVPYGFGGTNGLFALVERQHRYLFGTTREQLGKLAVTQRRHAQLNPNALLVDDLTLEDYLSARLIADPIRLFDCVMPCSGADVVVLMGRDRAEGLGLPGVELLSGEQRHNSRPMDAISLTTGAATFAEELFARAGIRRSGLDFVQLYDDYPIMEVIQLEDLGFAPKGQGGRFVEEHDLSIGGELPINTGGGQLSCGQAGAAGGMIGLLEAVEQLLGRAGERQIPQASYGLVSGFGMVGYGKGLSSVAAILGGPRS
jgi:acetyl-CoA acetyltransferase